MSLESSISKVSYEGNGVTAVFAFPFRVWKTDQVRVLRVESGGGETDISAQCGVELTKSGGSVTLPEPLAEGTALVIVRNMPFTQEDQYITGSRFDPHEIEDRFDQDCAERQQLKEGVDRAVKVPVTDSRTVEEYTADFWLAVEETGQARDEAQAAQAAAEEARATAEEARAATEQASDEAVQLLTDTGTDQVARLAAEADRQVSRILDAETGLAATLEGELALLREELEGVTDCCASTREALAAQESALEEISGSVEDLAGTVAGQGESLAAQQDSLAELRGLLEQQSAVITAQQAALEAQAATIEELQAAIEELKLGVSSESIVYTVDENGSKSAVAVMGSDGETLQVFAR